MQVKVVVEPPLVYFIVEFDQEIDIAGRFEFTRSGGTEDIQPPDMILSAQLRQFILIFFYQANHRFLAFRKIIT